MSKNYKIEKLEKKHNTTCNEIFKTDDLHQKILVDYMNQKKDLLIFIDVETIGLPIVKEFNNYYHYTDSKKYDSARIVQISWSIYDRSGNELVFRDYVIKPDNFKIPKSSTCIHGIPHAYAKKYGHNLDKILALLGNDISNVKFIVAHNLNFDKNIIYSELYRHNRQNIIQKLEGMVHICTAQTTKDLLKMRIMINFRYINKMPTLAELYTWCFGKPIENAHDSKYDVINLVSIFFYLQNEKGMYQLVDKKDNAFYFGKKKVLLNKQQLLVVNESIDKNILILACAGSGKTTTIMCRIKRLIDSGVSSSHITLTTFTRDATNDMKNKLDEMFGYKIDIEVGTIDSIARRNLYKYGKELIDDNIINVGEYSIKFLKFLKTHPDRHIYLSNKKFLFVDEFQDINDIQFGIINEYYKNGVKVIAVGDDAQNIYSFRGSNIEYILNFEKKLEDVAKHKLIVNYRSTPEIVKLANYSIENNKFQIPKKMVPHHKSICIKPTVEFFGNWDKQNEYVADMIGYYTYKGIEKHNIAILCRTNSPLNSLEELLTKIGINNVLLDGNGDVRVKIKKDHVCLSTIHKSKGLEWDVVFIINLNDEIFPTNKTLIDLEEERRLFYVATTRAKKYLHMTFTPAYGVIYVSRFISELNMNLYDFVDFDIKFIGLSDSGYNSYGLSVTELIKNLDGCDYINLKDMGILPFLKFKTQKLYNRYNYLDFIKRDDIYSDFGIFIDCLISRMFGQINDDNEGLYYEPAILTIANLKLNPKEYAVYKKYKLNFINNLQKIKFDDDDNVILEKLVSQKHVIHAFGNLALLKSATAEENIDGVVYNIGYNDNNIVLDIIDKLIYNSTKFNIPMEKIPIFPGRFLPEDFEEKMEQELSIFTNKSKEWADIIGTVWDISKCDKIVKEGRRRLLYKDIKIEDIKEYGNLFKDLFKNYVLPLKKEKVSLHYGIKADCGVHGEIDMLHNDTIIDFKTSCEKGIKPEWVLQVLCYSYLCKLNDIKINQVQIFNPLQGVIYSANIEQWASQDKGAVLIYYLLEKRKKLLERTKKIENISFEKEEKKSRYMFVNK